MTSSNRKNPLSARRLAVAGVVAAAVSTGAVFAAESSFASGSEPSSTPSSTSSAKGAPAAPPAGPAAANGADLDGTITSVSDGSLTVHGWFGTTRDYTISSKTTVHAGRSTSSVSKLAAGEHVLVHGTKSGSNYTANAVDVVAAHIDGQVSSVNGDTVTVVDRDGFTRTIELTSSTTFTKDGKSASRSALTDGVVVHAEGSVDSDHTSLDASSVDVQTKAPAGPAGPAGPGSGGPAGGPGGPAGAPAGAPKNAPKGAPKNAPKGAPKGVPSGAPKNAPSGAPSGAPSSSSSTSR